MEGSGGEEQSVFCGACGTRLEANVRFCTSCGENQGQFAEQVGGQSGGGAFSDWFFGRSLGRGEQVGGEAAASAPIEAMPVQDTGGQGPPTTPLIDHGAGGQPGGQRSTFESLFDIRFEHLITPKLVQFFYALSIVVLAVGAIVMIIAAFAANETTGVIFLFLAPLSALLYLITIRLWLELVIVAFKIRDGVERIEEKVRPSA